MRAVLMASLRASRSALRMLAERLSIRGCLGRIGGVFIMGWGSGLGLDRSRRIFVYRLPEAYNVFGNYSSSEQTGDERRVPGWSGGPEVAPAYGVRAACCRFEPAERFALGHFPDAMASASGSKLH